MDDSSVGQALWYGLFLMGDPIEGSLSKKIEHEHVTFGFKVPVPDEIDWDSEYDVEFIGYGNDGVNEGYAVSIPGDLMGMYFGAEVPHMTISVSDEGKPVDTAFLAFDPLDEPFTRKFKFGYYAKGNVFYR